MIVERQRGTIVSLHQSASRYGGSYGEIRGDDGAYYVFGGGHVYRNRSYPEVGAVVTFAVVPIADSYATAIDRVDKGQPRA